MNTNRPFKLADLLCRGSAFAALILAGCGSPWPSLLTPPLQAPARSTGAGLDAALIISVEDYTHLTDIQGAHENAEAWRYYFRETLALPENRVHLMRDRMSTRGRIERKVDDVVASVGSSGGRLWLVFIGHGTVLENGAGVLLAVDAERATTSIAENSVPLVDLFRRFRGVEHVALIDACFSGLDRTGDAHDPDKQMVRKLNPLDHRASGVVITATQPDEVAGQLRHGRRPAFSYLALSALRGWADEMPAVGNQDHRLTAGELVDAVKAALDKVNDHRPTPSVYPPGARDYVLVDNAADVQPDWMAVLDNPPATQSDGFWLLPLVGAAVGVGVWFHTANLRTGSRIDSAGGIPTDNQRRQIDREGYLALSGYAVAGASAAGALAWWLQVPEGDGGYATNVSQRFFAWSW